MMKIKKKHSPIACVALLLLAACDSKNKTPILGDRESFLNVLTTLKVDPKWKGRSASIPSHKGLSQTATEVLSFSAGEGESSDKKILMPPLVEGKRVYTMDSDGVVSAFELVFKGDQTKDGTAHDDSVKKVWSKATVDSDRVDDVLGGGMALREGVLYMTTALGGIIAMDAQKGDVIWQRSGYTPFRSKPYVDDKAVYGLATNNEVIALDKTTGNPLWSHTGIEEMTQLLSCSTPVVAYDSVIVAFSSGEVHCLNRTNGQLQWSDTITPVARIDTVTGIPHIAAMPVVDEGAVYLVSHGGRMTVLDIKTGSRLWQRELAGIHTPVIAGQFIFVLTTENELVCLDKKTGDVVWFTVLYRGTKDDPAPFFSGPVLAGDRLFVSSTKGDIVQIKAADGSKVESTFKIQAAIALPPVFDNQSLYLYSTNADVHVFH